MGRTVLIVEDELSIATLIEYHVKAAGFAADVAHDGEEALRKVSERSYDLVILDLMLPKVDGLTVCRTIRVDKPRLPILMVTAKAAEEDRIKGLNLGADDYITKPFSPKELVARIHAVLRRVVPVGDVNQQEAGARSRNGRETAMVLAVEDIKIYPERFEAFFHDDLLTLTRKEFELLTYFVQNEGLILSRDQLLSAVWNYDFAGDTRIVDVHVGRLRDKLEIDTKNPKYIHTVRGFGYKLEKRA